MYTYLYLTTRTDALRIVESGFLRPSRTFGGVYAIDVGGAWVPSVQHPSTTEGDRIDPEVAVLFESPELPTFAHREEVVWLGAYDAGDCAYGGRAVSLPIYNASLISLGAVEALLS